MQVPQKSHQFSLMAHRFKKQTNQFPTHHFSYIMIVQNTTPSFCTIQMTIMFLERKKQSELPCPFPCPFPCQFLSLYRLVGRNEINIHFNELPDDIIII